MNKLLPEADIIEGRLNKDSTAWCPSCGWLGPLKKLRIKEVPRHSTAYGFDKWWLVCPKCECPLGTSLVGEYPWQRRARLALMAIIILLLVVALVVALQGVGGR